jgi:phage gp46-like protein
MNDRYEGDPRIYLEEDGAEMDLRGGQPIMDQGLENTVLITLLTDEGWQLNKLETDSRKHIGSKFLRVARRTITADNMLDIKSAILQAFKPLEENKIIKDTEAAVSSPTGQRIEAGVLVKPVRQDPLILVLEKFGQLWLAQTSNPAHLK